jgi:arginase
VRRLARRCGACGIVERLGRVDAGGGRGAVYVRRSRSTARRDPGYTVELAARIGELLDAGARPLVLGGDCSILLGAMLALRRRGALRARARRRAPRLPPSGWSGGIGAVAGEDLAGVTGRLEPALSDIDGLGPYVARRRRRPLRRSRARSGERAAIAATGITVLDLDALRGGASSPRGAYWVHVDADVLDSALVPAVDSPAPDGLRFDELAALLRALLAGDAVGMQVTVFDPDLDPDGSQARALTDCLVSSLL